MATVRSRTPGCIRALLLLPLLCIGMPAAAQSATKPAPSRDTVYLYQVEIAESMVRNPTEAPQSCTAREKDPIKFPIDTTVVKTPQDTLVVRVVNVSGATRTPVKPPVDVDVYVGTRRRTLVTGADSLRLTANARQFAGQRITVQEPNTGRVFCSLTLSTPPGPGAQASGSGLDQRPSPDAEAVVSIGASFDFLDGLSANDLYSDVRVFMPRLWPAPPYLIREVLPFLANSGVGMQAGIYQGRVSASADSAGMLKYIYESDVEPRDTEGPRQIRRRQYERFQSRRENTLGLYMGVNLEIGQDLYWVFPLVEVRKESTQLTIRDTVISDTTVEVADNYRLVTQNNPVNRVISGTDYVPAVMTGPRLDMHRPTFNLVLQPLIGATYVPVCEREAGGNFSCNTEWRGFQYDVTFELEASQSGIKLGGEVRGFQHNDPTILIFLAKEFTIEKFAEFFTGSKGR